MTCYLNATQDIYEAHKNEPGACFHISKGHLVTSVEASGLVSVVAHGSASVLAHDSVSVVASGLVSVVAHGSASVLAYDSVSVLAYDSVSVRAYGSVSVEAYGSVSVLAHGSASVEAHDSVSVEAHGSASVLAHDSVSVQAGPCVPVQQFPRYKGKTAGGVVIKIPDLEKATPAEWAAFYALKPAKGKVTVFKAVNADLVSGYGTLYPVGETVTAPDWSDVRECGQGLHFGPTPRHARRYMDTAVRYLACEVDAATIVPLGEKVKAPSCRVLHEVDVTGEILARTS
jgi:hypothetical protein